MRWLVIGLPLALASCVFDSPEIKACEKSLLSKLKAPSTYKRVSAERSVFPDKEKPKTITVDIEYDAENDFGAPLRSNEHCAYAVVDGKAEL